MFENRTAFYLRDVFPREEAQEDGDKRKVIVLHLQLQPFTAEQAAELNVKSRLFDSKGEAHADMLNCALGILTTGPQRVTFARAADTELPSALVLANVEVEPTVKVRKDGETPQYAATITLVTDGMPNPKDLLYLLEGHAAQHFLTFENEQGDLLEREADTAARTPRLRNPKGRKGAKANGSAGEQANSAPV